VDLTVLTNPSQPIAGLEGSELAILHAIDGFGDLVAVAVAERNRIPHRPGKESSSSFITTLDAT